MSYTQIFREPPVKRYTYYDNSGYFWGVGEGTKTKIRWDCWLKKILILPVNFIYLNFWKNNTLKYYVSS